MATEEMREALALLTETVRGVSRYLAEMLADLEAGTYTRDHAAADQQYWESCGMWGVLDAVADAPWTVEDDDRVSGVA